MISNRSMPSATVIPQLGYPDVLAAAEWLERCFGFTVRLRIADHRIQMNVGDGAVVLTLSDNAPKASILVRVADVDAHHASTLAASASASTPQTFPYGERQYTAADSNGHTWTFSQSIADVAPEDWGGTPGKL